MVAWLWRDGKTTLTGGTLPDNPRVARPQWKGWFFLHVKASYALLTQYHICHTIRCIYMSMHLKNKQREGVLNSHGGNTVFFKKLGSSSCLHKHMFHFTLPFPDKCPTFIMGQHLQEWLYCAWFILCQWWYSSKQAKGCQYFLEGVWT